MLVSQARPVLIKLYFPGHQYREPLKKNTHKKNTSRSSSQSPAPPRSVLSVRKCLEQLPVHPPRWAVPNAKLLNLGEGGKGSQPDAGLGKGARRRERVKFQNKGRLHKARSVHPSPLPSLQASEAGPGFSGTPTSPPDPAPRARGGLRSSPRTAAQPLDEGGAALSPPSAHRETLKLRPWVTCPRSHRGALRARAGPAQGGRPPGAAAPAGRGR